MKKNTLLTILIILAILLIISISMFVIYNKYFKEHGEILYKLTYHEDLWVPGSTNEITVYEDKIEISTTMFCSTLNCKNKKLKKEILTYSKDNINSFINFITTNFLSDNNENNIELRDSGMNKYQRNIMRMLFVGEYFFETNIEEYKYRIEYSKSKSLKYNIYYKDNGSILVKKTEIDNNDDITNRETHTVDFSTENLNFLKNYMEDSKNDIVTINNFSSPYQANIINSMIKNDESYLNNVHKADNLLYTISYYESNCIGPTLYLYNDNTYDYYYKYPNNNEKLVPKTGTYNYDIQTINIDNVSKDKVSMYMIKDNLNNTAYTTYPKNDKLMEFLNSINVEMNVCLKKLN